MSVFCQKKGYFLVAESVEKGILFIIYRERGYVLHVCMGVGGGGGPGLLCSQTHDNIHFYQCIKESNVHLSFLAHYIDNHDHSSMTMHTSPLH